MSGNSRLGRVGSLVRALVYLNRGGGSIVRMSRGDWGQPPASIVSIVPSRRTEVSTHAPSRTGAAEFSADGAHRGSVRRVSTETKASFKTTEFFAYLAVLAGILIAGLIVDNAGDGGLGASKVWLYATILTVGYMVSRGLAKAGSREPYDDRDKR
jgi:hypothetical protein